MKYGLFFAPREVSEYVLGSNKIPLVPYQEDGNWEPFLPRYENQTTLLGHETNGCTVWGTQNCLETLMNRIYGFQPNFSERFTYLNVPVDHTQGADPHQTCESIRRFGLIDEAKMPMTDTIDAYLDTSDLTEEMFALGEQWLSQHDFKHEWVWDRRPTDYIGALRKALQTSPIGISVDAWHQEGDVYVSTGTTNNHWCMLFNIDEEGHPWVFDSYDHSIKKLSKDHNIRRAKRFWVNRKVHRDMRRHVSLLQSIINMLMSLQKRKTLLQLCEESIGIDVTPDDLVPDAVACAITVTTLIRKLDATFPKVAGTWTLWDILEHRTDYERVTVPSPETIVISPTGTGNGKFPGHVGIMMTDNVIASNDSASGKFLKNYTLDTWRKRYVDQGGYKIYMYKKKTQ